MHPLSRGIPNASPLLALLASQSALSRGPLAAFPLQPFSPRSYTQLFGALQASPLATSSSIHRGSSKASPSSAILAAAIPVHRSNSKASPSPDTLATPLPPYHRRSLSSLAHPTFTLAVGPGCALPPPLNFDSISVSSSPTSSLTPRRSFQMVASSSAAAGSTAGPGKASAPPFPSTRPTVWGQDHLKQKYPRLEGKVEAEVAIVGGGIGGLSVAYQLARKGVSVAVVERNVIGAGQTGKTTAHLMPWNDDYYSTLEKDWGRTDAALVGESHRQAIDEIERTVKEEGIECEFARIPGYLVPHDNSAKTRGIVEQKLTKHDSYSKTRIIVERMGKRWSCKQEYDAAKRCGFSDVYIVEGAKAGEIIGAPFSYALCFPSSAEFHPLMYLHGLAEAIVRMGGKIFECTSIFNHKGNTVSTKDGSGTVEASGAVVLATNSPMNHNLLVHARQTAERSYVVGLKVPKGSVARANWWDTFTPYHYVRTEPEEGYDVLVVGGGVTPLFKRRGE